MTFVILYEAPFIRTFKHTGAQLLTNIINCMQ